MDRLDRVRTALQLDNDALAAHRARIRLSFSVLAALALLPFTLLHLVNGDGPMFAMNLVLSSIMAANAFAMHRQRAPVLPFWLLCTLMVFGVCFTMLKLGSYGLLWSYPALFMFFFVLPRSQAMPLALLLLVAATGTAMLALGPPLAARLLMSLAFLLVMIHLVLNVIGDLQQALVEQAITDPLTGAYNRRHLEALLSQCIAGAGGGRRAADAGERQALLLIDIDHFKRINDTHGHDAGDAVLRRLVEVVGARKRSSDLLFRTGGEEFVLLLQQADLAAARQVAESLRQRLAQAELLPGQTVTVSIGLSVLAAGQTVDSWMKAADEALYQAKRQGRDRVVVASAA